MCTCPSIITSISTFWEEASSIVHGGLGVDCYKWHETVSSPPFPPVMYEFWLYPVLPGIMITAL